jgi:glucosylceramidase
VIADTTTGKVYYHSALYYIGHFSKFIRPGAQRIACTSDDDRLVATSFVNPDNSTATVVYNGSESDFDYYIWLANKTVELHIPGHAIETVVIK